MPDFGLFLFDVVSDILNGVTFIKEGNPIWGWTVIGVTFLPMTVVVTTLAIGTLLSSFSWWQKLLLILLLALILAPITIPLLTVGYICFVAYVFARKSAQPEYTPDDFENGQLAGMFKLDEGVLEANFQAVLGLFACPFIQSLETCLQC